MAAQEIRIDLEGGPISGLWLAPSDARAVLVLGHGAGAGMRHEFLDLLARALAVRGVATLRYQFPYMEAGRRAPDRPPLLEQTVRAAVADATRRAPHLPLYAGGKSMGGRMTSRAQAAGPMPAVRGLVFFGFPLHPPRRPGTERAAHLAAIAVPMLFLQGTRDDLADLDLLRPVLEPLAPGAELAILEGADHSFRIPARAARGAPPIFDRLAELAAGWMDRIER
jgi:hypothetical protein